MCSCLKQDLFTRACCTLIFNPFTFDVYEIYSESQKTQDWKMKTGPKLSAKNILNGEGGEGGKGCQVIFKITS